jgi:hypothetical protein
MRMTADNIKANLSVGDKVLIDNEGPFEVTYVYPYDDLGFRIDAEVVTAGYGGGESDIISTNDVKNPRVVIELLDPIGEKV